MKRTLLLAAATVALTAAPVQAQMQPNTGSDAGKSWTEPHRSSESGLPTESPQVESLNRGETRVYSGSSSSTVIDNTSSNQGGRVTTQSGVPADRTLSRSQTRSTTDTYGSGSTGNAAAGTASGSMLSRDDINARRGRGQNDLELMQTSLLNEFSAQGYTAVRDFHKNGQNYVANVQDQQGRWMNVELDPRTRAITPVR